MGSPLIPEKSDMYMQYFGEIVLGTVTLMSTVREIKPSYSGQTRELYKYC